MATPDKKNDMQGDGLVCAYQMTHGKAVALSLEAARDVPDNAATEDWRWLHFDVDDPDTKGWLTSRDDIDPNIADALSSIGTRPRFQSTSDGFLLILRGVNLNPGKDPQDMVSIRLLIRSHEIISSRRELVLAIYAMREMYGKGEGHKTPADFLIALSNGLVERMSKVVSELEDTVHELEETGELDTAHDRRGQILNIRSSTIMLRRYLAPQRDALVDLLSEPSEIFDHNQRGAMRLVADKISRYVEDLDAIRDRAAAVHEEITAQLAEQMNTTMYRLSIVATIFLPLSLLTGLLGINVGGMPGVDSAWAFWEVTIALIVMGVGGYYLMKYWKMI